MILDTTLKSLGWANPPENLQTAKYEIGHDVHGDSQSWLVQEPSRRARGKGKQNSPRIKGVAKLVARRVLLRLLDTIYKLHQLFFP
jgi:hypothetical protein